MAAEGPAAAAVRSIEVDPIGNVLACIGRTGAKTMLTTVIWTRSAGSFARSPTMEFLLLDGVPGVRRDGPSRWYPVGQAVKAFGRDGAVASGVLSAAT